MHKEMCRFEVRAEKALGRFNSRTSSDAATLGFGVLNFSPKCFPYPQQTVVSCMHFQDNMKNQGERR